jgi:hypothetical protein
LADYLVSEIALREDYPELFNQQRLGSESEAAIFDDLDSLYEK